MRQRSAGGSSSCWSWSRWPVSASAYRPHSPVASGSGSRLPGHSLPDPKVLLLDEPLGALDAKLRQQMQIELKRIQEQTGKTFLFVTHDQEEALTMSDTVVVMNAGLIEQSGSPAELYHRPRSRFVAGFIGDTNLLTCTVLANAKATSFASTGPATRCTHAGGNRHLRMARACT